MTDVSVAVDGLPGVRVSDEVPPPPRILRTGVPAFLVRGAPGVGRLAAGDAEPGSLPAAVRGFFGNGGELCYTVGIPDPKWTSTSVADALSTLDGAEDVDLVCAPDLMPDRAAAPAEAGALQREILRHCAERGNRFAILDAVPGDRATIAEQLRVLAGPAAGHGALYHPWLSTDGADEIPPCGHVAGVYARCDRRVGVHRAPANEVLEGVVAARPPVADREIARLYELGVNSVRAVPGRGLRVWGARTLSAVPAWRDVQTRRLVMTLARWIERFLPGVAFEPNDPRLWIRVTRELTAYLDGLFAAGVLRGRTPAEAFFVRCDASTNPPGRIANGELRTEIGVAVNRPAEFIVVRVLHGAGGVAVSQR